MDHIEAVARERVASPPGWPGGILARLLTLVLVKFNQYRVQYVQNSCKCSIGRLSPRVKLTNLRHFCFPMDPFLDSLAHSIPNEAFFSIVCPF